MANNWNHDLSEGAFRGYDVPRPNNQAAAGNQVQDRLSGGIVGLGNAALEKAKEDYNRGSKREKDVDPSGKDLKQPGTKGDSGKSPVFRGLLDYFPRAVDEVARVSERGAAKYSWKGWESVPDGISRYTDALARHLTAMGIEGPFDQDTGCLHRAQIAWNALASLELYLREQEVKKGA